MRQLAVFIFKIQKLGLSLSLVALNSGALSQTIFDDPLIYTVWCRSTIISKTADTLVADAKYNPLVNPFKIEIRQQGNSYSIETREVYSLSYHDKNIDSLRLFKNVKVSEEGDQTARNSFFEILYEDKYFAITRGLIYESFPRVNPLAKPDFHTTFFTVNKMTGRIFIDLSKKTYIIAMADKEEEIKKYIKENKLTLNALPDEIRLFKYYSRLKG